MTNIRKAVNSMTDEELVEILSPLFTVVDGKLHNCDGTACELNCPVYDRLGRHYDCKEVVQDFMLEEVKEDGTI